MENQTEVESIEQQTRAMTLQEGGQQQQQQQDGSEKKADLQERYIASMVLGAVGDNLAYRNGDWEFQRYGVRIHEQIEKLGGIEELSPKNFLVSDDTVMSIATADALVEVNIDPRSPDYMKQLRMELVRTYIDCMKNMEGRAPGGTTIRGVSVLKRDQEDGWIIPFEKSSGGCGAAMRSMPIGLRFPSKNDEDLLIAVAIDSGRMTHNCPTGYLGSLAGALFTALAIRDVPVIQWGKELMDILDKALDYIKKTGFDVDKNREHWGYFGNEWKKYLKVRNILDGVGPAKFPEKFGVEERDSFYQSLSYSGWGGSSGHDAPMIAYDALLAAGDDWKELCSRGFFHGGDSDSTAIMAGAWFGALYGFKGVPKKNIDDLEYHESLRRLGERLKRLSE